MERGFDPKIVPSIPDEEIWEDEDEEESSEEIDEQGRVSMLEAMYQLQMMLLDLEFWKLVLEMYIRFNW